MGFLYNAWYMFAWSDEVSNTALLARTVLDMPIVLYRNPDNGTPHALLDRCPHRLAPLSRGTIVNGNIRCGYHGLEFNKSGQCVRNPFSNVVPAAARVRVFPVVEGAGTIWIWPGDPEKADPALVPVIPHHSNSALRYVHGRTTAKSDYRLVSDNLMDLSHTAFLHPGFGGLEYMPKFRCWEEDDGTIVSDYVITDVNNFLGPMLPAERVNHHDQIRWIAPTTHILDSTTTARDDEAVSVYQPSAHILTPETSKTTHYFWSSALDKDSPVPDEELLAILRAAFDDQDKPMLEAVQSRMGDADLWDFQPIMLPNDAGSVRVRRKLAAMVAKETASRTDA